MGSKKWRCLEWEVFHGCTWILGCCRCHDKPIIIMEAEFRYIGIFDRKHVCDVYGFTITLPTFCFSFWASQKICCCVLSCATTVWACWRLLDVEFSSWTDVTWTNSRPTCLVLDKNLQVGLHCKMRKLSSTTALNLQTVIMCYNTTSIHKWTMKYWQYTHHYFNVRILFDTVGLTSKNSASAIHRISFWGTKHNLECEGISQLN